MKTLTKALICVCGLSLVSLALNAASEEATTPREYQLPTYTIEDIAALPEPVHNPVPAINARHAGMSLKLKFTVNENGRPEMVRLVKPLIAYSDVHKMSVAGQLRSAVSHWKFEPALTSNGEAVAVKVILPVQIIKKAGTPNTIAIATLILDDGSIDRS